MYFWISRNGAVHNYLARGRVPVVDGRGSLHVGVPWLGSGRHGKAGASKGIDSSITGVTVKTGAIRMA